MKVTVEAKCKGTAENLHLASKVVYATRQAV